MKFQQTTVPLTSTECDWLVLCHSEKTGLSGDLEAVDEALSGALSRVIEREDFQGKAGEMLVFPDGTGTSAKRILLVGLGINEDLNRASLQRSLQAAARKLAAKEGLSVAVGVATDAADSVGIGVAAEVLATSFVVGSSGQGIYKADQDRYPFASVSVAIGDGEEVAAGLDRGQILGESINLTRELVNRHADDIYPETFANRAADLAADLGIHGKILDQHQLEDERMGSLLAVARGSNREPRVVMLEYRGAGDDAPTLALCGKGVTFDSGGYSLKPSDGMASMKADMAGAATVLGAITAIARLKLPVNVMGFMGLVENMVSGHAYKLGDVLTARNGTTIEVLNTDAEGRLVLADVLAYAVDQGCSKMIDLATLTGACVVALGNDVVGAFTNDDDWCADVLAASKEVGEDVWQMPMFDSFAEQLKSEFADTKNVGTRWGGAITAAKFLEKFVAKTPWVHLDIAGPAYADSAKAHLDVGGTGAMVRTLVQVAQNFGSGS